MAQIICSAFVLLLILPWSVLMQDILVKELLLSSPRAFFTTVEAEGFLYLAGGVTNGNRVSSAVDVFDIASQTWNKTLTLPSARTTISAVHIRPHIYFVGGFTRYVNQNVFYKYDVDSMAFSQLPEPQLQALQLEIHESTLLVLASHGAQFLNLTDTAQGWMSNEDLDYVMQRVAGGIVFTHENLIFIVGGVNVSSRQPISDAWIYDMDSSSLKHYEDQITPFTHLRAIGETTRAAAEFFSFSGANNIAAAWINPRVFLFNIANDTWFNFDIGNVTNVLTVPGYTFIFTRSGFYTVDWTDPVADINLSYVGVNGTLVHSVEYEDTAVYFVDSIFGTTQPFVYQNGTWSPKALSAAIVQVLVQLVWPSQGVVIATADLFYLFRNGTLTFVLQTGIKNIILAHPTPSRIFVVHEGADGEFKTSVYGPDLVDQGTIILPFVPVVAYNSVLFDIVGSLAFNYETETTVDAYSGEFRGIKNLVVQGPYFFALGQLSTSTNTADVIDIYNYENDTWTTISDPRVPWPSGYRRAFNMNGALWLLTYGGVVTYDLPSDTWDEISFTGLSALPADLFTPLVIEVNSTAYTLASNTVAMLIFNNRSQSVSPIWVASDTDEELDPVHFTFSEKLNQIFITTSSTKIFTWNLADQQNNLFLLPESDEDTFMATSGNFLLVSASKNLKNLKYCDLSSKLWGDVPDLDNYIRPSVMKTITVNDTELILLAGGFDKEFNFFTDKVRLLNINSLASISPIAPNSTNLAPLTGGEEPEDNTALIVGIVVPVGAALIAGALLAFFLISKRQKKRKRGNRASMIGLESRYGQWYIPFSDLTFGEQLGQGGSGQVFKGTWKNTSVALKVSMTQANNSIIGELSLMMALRPHPNVVQLLGFSVHPETDSIVLVLEYCNQGALDSTLFDTQNDIALAQKVEWLIGVSKGLAHLHANNIVHRDIAARNVLLHQNDAKVTDFGMSREVAENKRGTTKSELGPIRWMAPEALKSKEYSVKSDVWSFGILAFEILARQEPHSTADPIQVGRLIRDEGRTPELPVTCPEELASVIKKCWQMEPAKRPSFEEITPQLEAVLSKI